MGLNTLSSRSDLQTIVAEWFNDIKTLLCIDIVPRNISGVPTDSAGSLGSSTYRWKDAYFSGAVYVGGVDISQIDSEAKDPHRITSGKAKTSGAPDFLAIASGLAATFEAATTDFVCYIEDVQYTFDSDLSFAGLTAAPGSNNTCLVNDRLLANREATKTLGEWDSDYIAIDTIGSEITALDGTVAAFSLAGGEVFIALVDTTNNCLRPIIRGFAGTTQETITNDDTITLYKLNTLLLKSDGIIKVSSTYWPESVAVAPAAGTTGKIYFERDTGKIAYDDGSAISYNYILLGYVVCSSSASVLTQCYDFDKSWRSDMGVRIEIKDTTTATIKGKSYAHVAGEIQSFIHDFDISISTDMAGSEVVAASTQYYIYLTMDGVIYISANPPRDALYPYRGFYHTSEYWRCIGELQTNADSEIDILSGGVVSDYYAASEDKSGIITASTQSFAGDKDFNDILKNKNMVVSSIAQRRSGLLDWSGKFYEKYFNVATIGVGLDPWGCCFVPSMNRIFVGNITGDNVTIINAETNSVVATVTCGDGARMACYCPSNDRVYVSNGSSSTLTVINAISSAVVGTVTVQNNPVEPTYCPSNDKIWVPNWGSASVSIVDCTNNSISTTLALVYAPGQVVYCPSNDKMYMCYSGNNQIIVLDSSTYLSVATINASGTYPVNGCYCPTNNYIYVSNVNSDSVTILDCETNSVIATIGVGTNPYGITYNPNLDRVFVTNYGSDNVSVINPETNLVVATITVGDKPTSSVYHPDSARMYVVNNGGGTLGMIQSF
jgi:YVTN family beta-propeller protein